MLLIGSLPDELDHVCITLIRGKEKLSFKKVCSPLLNYVIIRKKDQRVHLDELVEALTVREHSPNKKWEKMGSVTSKSRLRKR